MYKPMIRADPKIRAEVQNYKTWQKVQKFAPKSRKTRFRNLRDFRKSGLFSRTPENPEFWVVDTFLRNINYGKKSLL